MNENIIKFSLLENSNSFLKESINNVKDARTDKIKWKFSILHLVQSLELLLKEVLRRKNTLLLYENIDTQEHTITISKALERITNSLFFEETIITNKEIRKIKHAIVLRNKITHQNLNENVEYLTSKYFEVLSIISYIHSSILKTEFGFIIGKDSREFLVTKNKYITEQLKKAMHRIKAEGISEDNLIKCRLCDHKTFDTLYEQKCYLCSNTDSTEECDSCHKMYYSDQGKDLHNLFYYDVTPDGNDLEISDAFGYDESTIVCSSCYEEIEYEIKCKKEEHYKWTEDVPDIDYLLNKYFVK